MSQNNLTNRLCIGVTQAFQFISNGSQSGYPDKFSHHPLPAQSKFHLLLMLWEL